MEKEYQDIMLAATVEILALPFFYLIGKPEGLAFWVLLILLDSFLLKRLHFFTIIELQKRYTQYRRERRGLQIMQCIFMLGILILAFHSLLLAGALLLNDVVIDVLSFLQAMNEKNEK